MKPWFAKHILYPLLQFSNGESVLKELKFMEKSQWWSLDKLEREKKKALRRILLHAQKHSPYYAKKIPTHINYDFHSLPLLSKGELKKQFSDIECKDFLKGAVMEFTSGSSGEPLRFWADSEFRSSFRAAMIRGRRWAGLDLGSPEARFYGVPLGKISNFKERAKDMVMNRIRLSAFDLSDAGMDLFWKKLQKFRPAYLYGYTTAIHRFTRFLKERGVRPHAELTSVVTTSETLHPEEREDLENFWGVKVFNEYGSSECGIIAMECEKGGMHITAENLVVEFLNNGLTVNPEEPAEVVVTTLRNFAMPLIRYRLGDVASYSRQPCPCGRALPLMNIVEGRTNQMIRTPDGKTISGWIFYYIFRDLTENGKVGTRFRAYQKKLDHIHVLLENNGMESKETENFIQKKILETLGGETHITFEILELLPPTPSGKLLHFISELS